MVIKGETNHVLKSIYKNNPNLKIITPEDRRLDYSQWKFIKRIPQSQFFVYQGKVPFGFFKFWKKAEQSLYPNLKEFKKSLNNVPGNQLTQKNKQSGCQSA